MRDVVESVRTRLDAAAARTEAIGRYEAPRRRLGLFTVGERIVPLRRAWRLGVLLVGTDGTLAGIGLTTRAKHLERVGYVAESARRRDELRDAAARGGFADGETVNYDVVELPLDGEWGAVPASPLLLRDGRPVVRWAPHAELAAATPLAEYVEERAALLVDGGAAS